MFERTVSFWRRLVNRKPTLADGGGTVVAEDDRRAWHRIPTDFATTLQSVGGGDGKPLAARITNISLGGVFLVTTRSLSEGELVSMELPCASDAERSTVLACVIHVNRQANGRWAVGCTFARELNDEDLAAFGAKRQRPEPPDQRRWVRFPGNLTASCLAVALPASVPFAAEVFNISASGVGLRVREEVANGTLLSIELRAAHGDFGRTMLACVVHVTAQADHTQELGCNFIRSLSEADLKALA